MERAHSSNSKDVREENFPFLAQEAWLLRCAELPGLISYLLQRLFCYDACRVGISGALVFTVDPEASLLGLWHL